MSKTTVASTGIDLSDTFAFTGTVTGTPQGLTLINSTSSTSTVASFNIDNVFSSTYKFYRVYMRVEYSQNNGYFTRLLKSDGSARTSDYRYIDDGRYVNDTAYAEAGSSVSSWFNGRHSGGNVAGGGNRGGHFVMDFYDPFSSSMTHIFSQQFGYHDSTGQYVGAQFIGAQINAESHRGFTVVGNSTNIIQHDVKVYGVANA